MRHAAYTLLALVGLTSTVGCFSKGYPTQWPPISLVDTSKCPDISGEFMNIDIDKEVSLSAVLLRKWYGTKYLFTDGRVTIRQKIGSINVSLHYGNETLIEEKEFTLDKDYYCSEGGLIFKSSGSEGGGGVGAYSWNTFAFQKAQDGSLILHYNQSAIGVVAVFPIAGSASEYRRFEKYNP